MPKTPVQTQFEFPCLDFPGRKVLYAHECASQIGVTPQHILDLIEEGKLGAVNIAGVDSRRNYWRIPIDSWRKFLSDNSSSRG